MDSTVLLYLLCIGLGAICVLMNKQHIELQKTLSDILEKLEKKGE